LKWKVGAEGERQGSDVCVLRGGILGILIVKAPGGKWKGGRSNKGRRDKRVGGG